jgi:hypothetical protein
MLGELLGEELGQITTTRVLPADGGRGPRVEVSFQSNGTLLGQHSTDMGTYIAEMRPDGSMIGEGQGVTRTERGETATWRGQGVGHFTSSGRQSWRGSILYEANSEGLARLNGVACVFEDEVDESGKMEVKSWEWK